MQHPAPTAKRALQPLAAPAATPIIVSPPAASAAPTPVEARHHLQLSTQPPLLLPLLLPLRRLQYRLLCHSTAPATVAPAPAAPTRPVLSLSRPSGVKEEKADTISQPARATQAVKDEKKEAAQDEDDVDEEEDEEAEDARSSRTIMMRTRRVSRRSPAVNGTAKAAPAPAVEGGVMKDGRLTYSREFSAVTHQQPRQAPADWPTNLPK